MSTTPSPASATELPPMLAARFDVREEGPSGWLCTSHVVEDRQGKTHLLKLLRPELCSRSARQGRTGALLEAWRAALALRHPGIAGVIDLGPVAMDEAVGAWLLVERVDAPTLGSLVEEGPIATSVAASLLLQVVEILDEASPHGPHLGLSPNNVFVEIQPVLRVRLTDYGTLGTLRRDVTTLSLKDRGRSAWMSPEQLSGRHSGAQTDMWQLGALLRFALTGASPARPADHGRLNPEAKALIRWLMHPDPLSRPDDFDTVRKELEALATGSAVDPTPVSATLRIVRKDVVEPEPPPVWLRYAPPVFALGFALAALALFLS